MQAREAWRDRRAYVRSAALHVIRQGEHTLESTLLNVKQSADYENLSPKDRDIVRQTLRDIRTIVGGWGSLNQVEEQTFASGAIAPSTLAAGLRR